MMSELKTMSVQKRADIVIRLYNHINSLIDNVDNIKNDIAYHIANGRHKYILYTEDYRKKVKYYSIVNKMIIYPRTDTIRSRIKQNFPECKVYEIVREYRDAPDKYYLIINWGGCGCFG